MHPLNKQRGTGEGVWVAGRGRCEHLLPTGGPRADWAEPTVLGTSNWSPAKRYVLGSANLPQGHRNLGLQSETTISSKNTGEKKKKKKKNTGEKSLGTHQDGHLDSLPCGPRPAGALKSRLPGCPSP